MPRKDAFAILEAGLDEDLLRALLDPENLSKVRQFLEQLAPLPNTINIGGQAFYTCSLHREGEERVSIATMAARARELGLGMSDRDMDLIIRTPRAFAAIRRRFGLVFIGPVFSQQPDNVYCAWYDEGVFEHGGWLYPSRSVDTRVRVLSSTPPPGKQTG